MVSLKLESGESGLFFMLDVRARRDDFVYPASQLFTAARIVAAHDAPSCLKLKVRCAVKNCSGV